MNIFRVFRDNKGGIIRDPKAIPEAKILVNNPRRDVKNVTVKECEKGYSISTAKIGICICKKSGLMKVKDLTSYLNDTGLRSSDSDFEYVTVKTINTANMSNYTKNRLHGNGTTAIYPTFVNVADQPTLNGDVEIVTITLKAKKNIKLDLKAIDGVLVDKNLNSIKF